MKKQASDDYWWLWITGALAVFTGTISGDSGGYAADFFRGVAVGIGMSAILIGFWRYILGSRKTK
jgi:ABC-type uncharacterized transport system permease subunit